MIHPGRNPRAPMDIAELVRKEGGDLGRTIMCHIDRTIADVRAVLDLAQTGDVARVRPLRAGDLLLSVPARLRHAQRRRAHGSCPRPDGGRTHRPVLLSHDIAYKHALVKYGGYGYHHLLVNVVPRLRRKGVDDAGLRRLLVENSARAFAFA